jgi:hypothetical protein
MKKIASYFLILFRIHYIPKKDKLRTYKIMKGIYKRWDSEPVVGMCAILKVHGDLKHYKDMYYLYPELFIHEPKKQFKRQVHWFHLFGNGVKKRIEILEKAIKILQK